MATTWDEIRITSLQKMFLISGNEIEENDSTNPYLASMPGAYNEAVRLLSTTNRYITKVCSTDRDKNQTVTVVDLSKITDFYQQKPNGIYYKDGNGDVFRCYNYKFIGNEHLILQEKDAETYLIYYYAYPLKVTKETSGNEDLQIDDDVASLIPLYIASQLYKDDDISIATTYRNEFEVGRELLVKERNGSVSASFASASGWW